MDSAVLRLGIVGVHSADRCYPQSAVGLDLRYHGAERVNVCLEHHGILLSLPPSATSTPPFVVSFGS